MLDDPSEIQKAIGGFRYFALDQAAGCLADAFATAFPAGDIEDSEEREAHLAARGDDIHRRLDRLEDDYCAAIPRDAVIEAAFRDRLRRSPADFATPDAAGS